VARHRATGAAAEPGRRVGLRAAGRVPSLLAADAGQAGSTSPGPVDLVLDDPPLHRVSGDAQQLRRRDDVPGRLERLDAEQTLGGVEVVRVENKAGCGVGRVGSGHGCDGPLGRADSSEGRKRGAVGVNKRAPMRGSAPLDCQPVAKTAAYGGTTRHGPCLGTPLFLRIRPDGEKGERPRGDRVLGLRVAPMAYWERLRASIGRP